MWNWLIGSCLLTPSNGDPFSYWWVWRQIPSCLYWASHNQQDNQNTFPLSGFKVLNCTLSMRKCVQSHFQSCLFLLSADMQTWDDWIGHQYPQYLPYTICQEPKFWCCHSSEKSLSILQQARSGSTPCWRTLGISWRTPHFVYKKSIHNVHVGDTLSTIVVSGWGTTAFRPPKTWCWWSPPSPWMHRYALDSPHRKPGGKLIPISSLHCILAWCTVSTPLFPHNLRPQPAKKIPSHLNSHLHTEHIQSSPSVEIVHWS